jgi:hypothetical protein
VTGVDPQHRPAKNPLLLGEAFTLADSSSFTILDPKAVLGSPLAGPALVARYDKMPRTTRYTRPGRPRALLRVVVV